jgi:hypothetical protein
MHSFKDYLKEEVMPTVLSNGSIDIANESVRDEINAYLYSIATRPCVTPYVALNRMRKLLAYFHIYLPKRAYMEGRHGVEVWGINQFGDKMGMTDQGEFVKSVPAKFHLFFHYHLVGSHYFIDAKIVNDEELEDKVSTTEKMFAEGHDAACQQSMAKAVAPKEAIKHTDDSTESTKKAVATSQRKSDKKLSADSLDESHADNIRRKYRQKEDDNDHTGNVHLLTRVFGSKKERETSKGLLRKREKQGYVTGADSAKGYNMTKDYARRMEKLKEEELDEVSLGKLVAYKNKAGEGREKGVALADKKMKGKAKVNASAPKHPYMEESLDETRMPASVIKHKQRIANMTPEEKAKKFAGKSEEQLKSMARRHGYGKDSNEYSKHVKEEQIDELKQQTLKAYVSAAKADRKMSKKVVEKGLDTEGKFKHAAKKRKQGIERASDRLEEKAPPGAKFERMVKHIKKGYSKGGLTAKEKSIAYATAWKAKKKESD